MEPTVVRDVGLVVTGGTGGPLGRLWFVRRTSNFPGKRGPGSGDVHEVRLAAGQWSCDCRAWLYKRACRHVDAAKDLFEDA
jgi:hypothetical protein